MTDFTNRIGIDLRKYNKAPQPQRVVRQSRPTPTKKKRKKKDPSFYQQVVDYAKTIL